MIGIRVRSIIDLLDSQSFAAEWRTAGARLMDRSPLAGFNPLKDLAEVLIASSGEGDNPPVLIVLRGRFDVDRLASSARRYHGTPLVEDGKQAGVIAILDSSTAIAGDRPLVLAAIDRRASGGGVEASLAARIEPLRTRYAIWGIGDRLNDPPVHTAQPGPMDSLDQFEFGVDLAHGLDLNAKLHVRSPEDAGKMASVLVLAETMLKNSQPSAAGAKVEMHTEGGWLTLSLSIPPEALNKAIQDQRAAIQSALLSRLGGPKPAAVAAPSAPAPSKAPAMPSADTRVILLPGKR